MIKQVSLGKGVVKKIIMHYNRSGNDLAWYWAVFQVSENTFRIHQLAGDMVSMKGELETFWRKQVKFNLYWNELINKVLLIHFYIIYENKS